MPINARVIIRFLKASLPIKNRSVKETITEAGTDVLVHLRGRLRCPADELLALAAALVYLSEESGRELESIVATLRTLHMAAQTGRSS